MSHFQNHRNAVLAAQAKQDEKARMAAEAEQERSANPGPADPGPRPEHLTPLQRHKANLAVQRKPAAAPAPSRTTGRAAAIKAAAEVKSEMVQAIESLHGLDLKDKIALKKKLVEQFRPAAEKLLEARARDDDFSAWIVWLFDIGRIEEFMEKAPAAITLGWLTRPLGMKRSLQVFYFDKILEWSKAQFEAGYSPEPYFSTAYGQHGKMLDVVAAKYHKLAGDMLLAQAEQQADAGQRRGFFQKALETLGFARKADDKIGVNTRIADTEKALKNLPEANPPEKTPDAESSKEAGGEGMDGTEGDGGSQQAPPAGGGPDAKESAERGSKGS